jgi:TonB family protein
VTLSSGAVIRVRSSDVNDVRLTFLRTVLAEARSRAAAVGSAQSACAPSSASAQVTKPATSATSPTETSEGFAPTGAEQPAQAGAPPLGVEIQADPAIADTAKADFDLGPWTRRLIAAIKRCWFVPYALFSTQGRVTLGFLVQKDGKITDLAVDEASSVTEFNKSALAAVTAVNRAAPLPPEYPSPHVALRVTFHFGTPQDCTVPR